MNSILHLTFIPGIKKNCGYRRLTVEGQHLYRGIHKYRRKRRGARANTGIFVVDRIDPIN